jgi:hypothetical protein
MAFLLLGIFIVGWIAIAVAAKRRKLSNVIAIGGGFIGGIVSTIVVTYGLSAAGLLFDRSQIATFARSSTSISVQSCGEPIVIEECHQDHSIFPTCRIKNIAQVPLGKIDAWAYDKNGVQVGSSDVVADIVGIPPQREINTTVMPGAGPNEEFSSIVLCSVDPQSPLGAKRFGIGQAPSMEQ